MRARRCRWDQGASRGKANKPPASPASAGTSTVRPAAAAPRFRSRCVSQPSAKPPPAPRPGTAVGGHPHRRAPALRGCGALRTMRSGSAPRRRSTRTRRTGVPCLVPPRLGATDTPRGPTRWDAGHSRSIATARSTAHSCGPLGRPAVRSILWRAAVLLGRNPAGPRQHQAVGGDQQGVSELAARGGDPPRQAA